MNETTSPHYEARQSDGPVTNNTRDTAPPVVLLSLINSEEIIGIHDNKPHQYKKSELLRQASDVVLPPVLLVPNGNSGDGNSGQ